MRYRKYPKEIGQELLEYALILPLFVLLIFGIADLGRVAFYFSMINNAARDGARQASLKPAEGLLDENIILNSVLDKVQFWGNIDSNDISICWISHYDNKLEQFVTKEVRVVVSYPMAIITPFVGRFFAGNNELILNTSSTMHLEYFSINYLATECGS